ncbi:MAG: hypothetical protein PUB51_02525 [Oscillospiraceae bacterium]|nr:hypothetical protein [Oscillospiraceae bacterium]
MVLIEIWQGILVPAWGFFTETPVPGFESVTFADLLIAIMLINVALVILRSVFGFGHDGTSSRSGTPRNPKISDERKGDEL